jgi:hypothetical protein
MRQRIGRFTRASCCRGKHRFSAAKAKRMAERESGRSGEDLHAYVCPFCKHWHIGHRRPYRETEPGDAMRRPA